MVKNPRSEIRNGDEDYSRRDLVKLLAGAGVVLAGCSQASEAKSSDSVGSRTEALSGFALCWVDTVLGVGAGVTPRTGDLASNTNAALGADVVIAKGCVTAGDGGGGIFYWSTSGTDDGGTVIVPNGSMSGCWKRVLPEGNTYNVYWFGVAGDLGVATNAADAALGSNPGTIVIPSGGGQFSTPVTLSKHRTVKIGTGNFVNNVLGALFTVDDDTVIQGCGRDTVLNESSLASGSHLDAYLVLVASPNRTTCNITFRDLQIKGYPGAAASGVVATVNTYNTHGGLIENLWLNKTSAIGVQISGVNDATRTQYSDNVVVRNCLFTKVGGTSGEGGGGVNVAITNAQHSVVEDCIFDTPFGNAAIDVEPNTPYDYVRMCRIARNTIDATSSPIRVYLIQCTNDAQADVFGNQIVDNICRYGIVGIGCGLSNTLISGNTLIDCSYGITVGSDISVGPQYVTVQDNKAYQTVDFGVYVAILLGTANHCSVIGNEARVLPSGTVGMGEDPGVTTHDYNVFFNNMTPSGIAVSGAHSVATGNILLP